MGRQTETWTKKGKRGEVCPPGYDGARTPKVGLLAVVGVPPGVRSRKIWRLPSNPFVRFGMEVWTYGGTVPCRRSRRRPSKHGSSGAFSSPDGLPGARVLPGGAARPQRCVLLPAPHLGDAPFPSAPSPPRPEVYELACSVRGWMGGRMDVWTCFAFRTCFASGCVAETQWAKGRGAPK